MMYHLARLLLLAENPSTKTSQSIAGPMERTPGNLFADDQIQKHCEAIVSISTSDPPDAVRVQSCQPLYYGE